MHELVVATIRELALRGVLPRDLAGALLSESTQIDALGIDSLGKLNLLSELEARADVTLRESQLQGLRTLHDLAEVLRRATP